jgi:tetratricopeptide (TPR) repeat protein
MADAVDQVLRLGLESRRAGRLAEADQFARAALQAKPDHAGAAGLAGLVALDRADPDRAGGWFRRALAAAPAVPQLLGSFANALEAANDRPGAARIYRRALHIQPDSVPAHFNLALALHGTDAALLALCRTLVLAPDLAPAWSRLATARRDRSTRAVAEARYSLRIAIDAPESWRAWAFALVDHHRETVRAEDGARHAAALAPSEAANWSLLGDARRAASLGSEARTAYRRALAITPDQDEPLLALGLLAVEDGEFTEARDALANRLRQRRGPPFGRTPYTELAAGPARADALGLAEMPEHGFVDRREQIAHLADTGRIDASYRTAADDIARFAALDREQRRAHLSGPTGARLAALFQNVAYLPDDTPPQGPMLNGDHDWAAIERRAGDPDSPVTHVSPFLSPAGLAAVRAYCRDLAAFNRLGPDFVAAEMDDAFHGALLYRLAKELRGKLPNLLADRPMITTWAYRYADSGRGVKLHTDDAAVTVNFWLTDDSANERPDTGGLELFIKEQPPEQDWMRYNSYKDDPSVEAEITAYLGDAARVRVPYGGNRGLIFKSILFHRSDPFRFRPGFANRRVNVTMLFGRRNDRPWTR